MLAAKACFDVREAPAFWALMELSETEEEKMPLEILSTHPTHKNRESNLASLVPEAIEVSMSMKPCFFFAPDLGAQKPVKIKILS